MNTSLNKNKNPVLMLWQQTEQIVTAQLECEHAILTLLNKWLQD